MRRPLDGTPRAARRWSVQQFHWDNYCMYTLGSATRMQKAGRLQLTRFGVPMFFLQRKGNEQRRRAPLKQSKRELSWPRAACSLWVRGCWYVRLNTSHLYRPSVQCSDIYCRCSYFDTSTRCFAFAPHVPFTPSSRENSRNSTTRGSRLTSCGPCSFAHTHLSSFLKPRDNLVPTNRCDVPPARSLTADVPTPSRRQERGRRPLGLFRLAVR